MRCPRRIVLLILHLVINSFAHAQNHLIDSLAGILPRLSDTARVDCLNHLTLGMRITADRVAILQQNKQMETTIKITDLVLPDGEAGGTEVVIKISIISNNRQCYT